jgi:hypothetical protein
MRVTMIMTFMPMVMSVTVVSMPKCGQADDVDEEAQDADNQELIEALQLVALPEALRRVEDDLDTDKQEEHSVRESRKRIDLAVAVGEASIGAPLAHDCGCKTHGETGAVEKHVDAVGE